MDEKLGVELKKIEKTLFIIKMKFIFQSILRNLFIMVLTFVVISYIYGKNDGDFKIAVMVFTPGSILLGIAFGLVHYRLWLIKEIKRLDYEIRKILEDLIKSDDSK